MGHGASAATYEIYAGIVIFTCILNPTYVGFFYFSTLPDSMKKIIAIIILLFSSVILAQESTLQEDAEQLVKLTFDISDKHQTKYMLTRGVSEDNREAFKQEYDAAIKVYIAECAKFYKEKYTHTEIKEMIQFYETPVGKKMAKDGRKLLGGEFPKDKEWNMEIYALKDRKKS